MCLESYVVLSKRQEESPLLVSSTSTSSTDNKGHKIFSQGISKVRVLFLSDCIPLICAFWKPYFWSNYLILKGHSGYCAENANADY